MSADRPRFIEKPRAAIQTRIGGVEMAIDYGSYFGDMHDPLRARKTTEELLQKVTHGQTISAEYSNPLGFKHVQNHAVPATWAIASALNALQRNFSTDGQKVRQNARRDKEGKIIRPKIERNSSIVITPIRKDGKRLVTERGADGDRQQLFIHWISEEQAQQWMRTEIEHDKRQRNSR